MIKRIKPTTRTQRIEGEIQRLVSQVLSGRPELLGLDGTWDVPLDVYETERNVVVEAEVPGIEAADLRISIDASQVEIRGLKREDRTGVRASYIRLERESGLFRRTLALPSAVATDKATAVLENGVLTIVMPKAQAGLSRDKVVPIGRTEDPQGESNG
ncbi:MAG: Hsp20/alpha crystallin family protein [Acidobacteriota bacterium]|nr:Hsp20/alpha crystallin family protein [Acidobacteriota bacterium]